MSGYRVLHRYSQFPSSDVPTWSVAFSSQKEVSPDDRLYACDADGMLRCYILHEKTASDFEGELNASALTMTLQSELVSEASNSSSSLAQLGSCRVSVASTSDDLEVVTSASLDGRVRVWRRQIINPQKVVSSSLSSSSTKEVDQEKPALDFAVERATGTTLVTTRDGTAAVGCRDGTVALTRWDISTDNEDVSMTEVVRLGDPSSVAVTSLCAGGSDPLSTRPVVAAGHANGTVDVYDAQQGQLIHRIVASSGSENRHKVRGLAYTSDGGLLLVGSEDGTVRSYDVRCKSTPMPVGYFVGHRSWVMDLAACPTDGRRFATASADCTVRIWDLSVRDSVHTFDAGHTELVWGLSFNGCGSRLASCGDDGSIQIYSFDIR